MYEINSMRFLELIQKPDVGVVARNFICEQYHCVIFGQFSSKNNNMMVLY